MKMLKLNETTPSYRLPERCCNGRVSCIGKAFKSATCACKFGMHEYLRCDTKGASLKEFEEVYCAWIRPVAAAQLR